jgi:hypothetical protein
MSGARQRLKDGHIPLGFARFFGGEIADRNPPVIMGKLCFNKSP